MAEDAEIVAVASSLRAAGLVGAAAQALLLHFLSADADRPGVLTSGAHGFAWSKSISSSEGLSVPLGVGTLTSSGISDASCVAGFHIDEVGLVEASILVSWLTGASGSSLTLTLDRAIAEYAEVTRDAEYTVTGFNRANRKPAAIPLLGALSMELAFRRGPDCQLVSSISLYGAAGEAVGIAEGVLSMSLDPDYVLLLHRFFGIGLYVPHLVLDLSSERAAGLGEAMPEVCDARWKGIGVREATVFVPLGAVHLRVALDALAIGIDGEVSLRSKITYCDEDPDRLISTATGALDIRNGEVVKGGLDVTFDWGKTVKDGSAAAARAPVPQMPAYLQGLQDRLTQAQQKWQSPSSAVGWPDALVLHVLVRHGGRLAEPGLWGVDVSLQGVPGSQSAGLLTLHEPTARIVLWSLLGVVGSYLLWSGADDKDEEHLVAGCGLLFLLLLDLANYLDSDPGTLLPRFEELTVREFGCRLVHVPNPGGPAEANGPMWVVQMLLSVGARMRFADCALTRLADLAMTSLTRPFAVFGGSLDQVTVQGPLDLDLLNIPLALQVRGGSVEFATEVDDAVGRLTGEEPWRVKVRQLPQIHVTSAAGQPSGAPKPLVGASLIARTDQEEVHAGLALKFRGFEHPQASTTVPVTGLVIMLLPEFSIDFDPTLTTDPRFRFVVPPTVLVEGRVEGDKPLPGGGEQSRLSVEVGVINQMATAGATISQPAVYDMTAYRYRFGGELAWGTSRPAVGGPFDFLFAEVHYDGSSPIAVIGPIGVYGLGGMFGRNIAPGFAGDHRDAAAIAAWIGSGKNLSSLLDWPAAPTEQTWHPARGLDGDLYLAGLRLRAGSLDGAKTVDVDSALVVGLQESWAALAGKARIRPTGTDVVVILGYDHPSRSVVARAVLQMKRPPATGRVLSVQGPLELAARPERSWFFLGHYDKAHGGPVVLRALDTISAGGYLVYDTGGLDPFGFAFGEHPRPAITGAGLALGMIAEFGPKRLGPDWLHLSAHAAAGFNLGLGFDPLLLIGQLYLAGGLRLKVCYVTLGLDVDALLQGSITDDTLTFHGALGITVGLPWPIPDLDVELPFHYGDDDPGTPLPPKPQITTTASVIERLRGRASSTAPDSSCPDPAAVRIDPPVPIDAVVSLNFGRPIRDIRTDTGDTALLALDLAPTADRDALAEQQTTAVGGDTFTTRYCYDLVGFRVDRTPTAGGPKIQVPEVPAAWVPPPQDNQTAATDPTGGRRTLTLGALLPPQLGYFQNLAAPRQQPPPPPCAPLEPGCLMRDGPPDLRQDVKGLRSATTRTGVGAIVVRESPRRAPSPLPGSGGPARLTLDGGVLWLSDPSAVRLPSAASTSLALRLEATPTLSRSYGFGVDVAAGGGQVGRVVVVATFDARANVWVWDSSLLDQPPGLAVKVQAEAATADLLDLLVRIDPTGPATTVERLTVHGPVPLPPGTTPDGRPPEGEPDDWLIPGDKDEPARLGIRELCVTSPDATAAAWQGSDLAAAEDGVGIWAGMLWEPDHEYTVSCGLRITGSAEGPDPGRNASMAVTVPAQVTFRTEASPSQDVAAYVGFSYPRPGMQPLYPDAVAPIVAFRYAGLIKQIYAKFPGANTLETRLTRLGGQITGATPAGTLAIDSSPADRILRPLIASCLRPGAAAWSQVQADTVPPEDLQPGQRYALTVAARDSDGPPPFRVAFATSQHRCLAEHLDAAAQLMQHPAQLPLLDSAVAPAAFAAAVADSPGWDDLVERLYRDLLGVPQPQLAQRHGLKSSATHLLGAGPDGDPLSFGVVLEMAEPILGKEGVAVAGGAPAGNGTIWLPAAGLLLVRDRSGGRLLCFASPDGTSIEPITAALPLHLQFDGRVALRAVIGDYVRSTLTVAAQAAMTEAGIEDAIRCLVEEVLALPAPARASWTGDGILLIPPLEAP